VAIFTALLAALGAVVSYQGNHLMNEVLLYKNEAVLKKPRPRTSGTTIRR